LFQSDNLTYFQSRMSTLVNIKISDILILIDGDSPQLGWHIPSAYQPFISCGPPNIVMRLQRGNVNLHPMQKVFDGSPIWSLYRAGIMSILVIYEKMPGQTMILVYPPPLKTADLYFPADSDRFNNPFFGPVLELLMINYLARRTGVVIHGCGVAIDNAGLLFVGESGAGKSTLANLWDRAKAATVLSDDRTIVRHIDGEFRMYGTPWHGEAKFGSPRGVKLENIFFLRHGRKNAVETLSGSESVLKLLQCSFPPYWDAAGMEYTLEFFEEIATRVPCHELAFEPDKRVIDLIRRYADTAGSIP
jgi:hypothetical protein